RHMPVPAISDLPNGSRARISISQPPSRSSPWADSTRMRVHFAEVGRFRWKKAIGFKALKNFNGLPRGPRDVSQINGLQKSGTAIRSIERLGFLRQVRTEKHVGFMSALPPKADIDFDLLPTISMLKRFADGSLQATHSRQACSRPAAGAARLRSAPAISRTRSTSDGAYCCRHYREPLCRSWSRRSRRQP